MYKSILTIQLLLLTTSISVFSQIFSKIVYDNNNKPLSSVSVFIKNKNTGTITNFEGKFTFYNVLQTDTIIITHIAYKYKQIAVCCYSDSIIRLQRKIYNLDNIKVTAESASEIVDKVIKNLDKNYFKRNNNVKGFFREELYKKDTLKSVNEAEIFINFPYKKTKKGEVNILNKQTLYLEKNNNLTSLINSPLSIIELNEVFNRNSIFNSKKKRSYIFSFDGNFIDENGNIVYKIIFENKVLTRYKNKFAGTLYVCKDDYAITHLQIKNYRTEVTINYKLRNDKYITSNFILEKYKIIKKDTIRAKINYATTNFDFKQKGGNFFHKNDALQQYSNSYNKKFWINNISILPDSLLYKQIKILESNMPIEQITTNKIESKKNILYKPAIAIGFSSKSFNSLDLLSYNINNINHLFNYKISSMIKNNNLSSLIKIFYINFLSIPIQGAEAERRLLKFKGYKTNIIPIPSNKFYSSYAKKITNKDLEYLKNKNTSDFLRLHTVRFESNFNTVKKIEEELFKTNFLSNVNKNSFLNVYFIDYLMRRLYLSTQFLFSSIEIKYPKKSELQMPFSTNKINSYVKYLYTPQALFQRDIAKSNLSEQEITHTKQIKWLSTINFIPAITNLLPPIKIGKSYNLRFSGGYIPIAFGHMLEQNLYLSNKKNLTVFNFKQYVSFSKTGFSIGTRFINKPIFKNITCTIQIDYWKQPNTLSFYDTKLDDGFAVKQIFTLSKKKWNVWIGYYLKTKGFIDYATSLNSDNSVLIGGIYFL